MTANRLSHLLEAVPNFSEARRPEVVEEIVSAARSVEQVRVLDVHSDADHNRSVLSLVGEREPLEEAVFRSMEVATRLIDLRKHTGEHPRVGATDVVPFVPLGQTPMSEAVAAARSLGGRVADRLRIPVYFYEEAATSPARTNLERVRGKGFEELARAISSDPDRKPDLGPGELHESAGATIIGARGPLIAYNVYLNTENLAIARSIAAAVRHSSGGLRFVKALGMGIPARGQVQVSMNLTNHRKTAVHTVFNLVKSEAEAFGVTISDSEVVGLIPLDALIDAARHYLRLHEFDPEQVLEMKLLDTER